MVRVGIGMQQADGDTLHIQLDQPPGEARRLRLVEWLELAPVEEHSLAHFEAKRTGNERLRALEVQVVQVISRLAPDLDHIAETDGCDQGRPRAAPLDEAVGDERGAVDDAGDVRERNSLAFGKPDHAVEHSHGRVCGRGQVLEDADDTVVDDD